MLRRVLMVLAALVAVAAVLFALQPSPPRRSVPRPSGRNNTVLFLANSEYGLANALLATSHALLVNHGDVEVHFACFEKREKDVATISEFAAKQTGARPIRFHRIKGPTLSNALNEQGHYTDDAIHAPGVAGSAKLCNNIQGYIMPWTAPAYLALYKEVSQIIEDVDPSLVALDPQFGPALDATKDKNRSHAIVSPNSLRDSFAQFQPRGAMFWKYPAIGSGFPYPVPWSLIPSNIYVNFRFIYSVLVAPLLAEKKKWLRDQGLSNPLDFFSVYNEDMTWICQSAREIDFPVETVPENVRTCGPIYLSTASAAEQDPELAEWLERAPTMLINLGSTTDYNEKTASEMVGGIKKLLDKTDTQVLWKFQRRKYHKTVVDFSDDFLEPVKEHLGTRLRVSNWIKIDPAAMMATGNIVASVHHGGANCFHEAIASGVPQVVLPLWADLYDYATRVEWLGVGVWGSRRTAPNWTAEELGDAFLKVLSEEDESRVMRAKAKKLASLFDEKSGRVCAAAEIAKSAKL